MLLLSTLGLFALFDDLSFCMHNGEIIDIIVLFVLLYFTKVRFSLIDYDSADFQAFFLLLIIFHCPRFSALVPILVDGHQWV